MQPTFASLLLTVRARLGLLAKTTPTNVDAEIVRLTTAAEQRQFPHPQFVYASREDDTREMLRRLTEAIPKTEETRALRRRADELMLEVQLAEAVGSPAFGALADARFACDESASREARALADVWILCADDDEGIRILSDSAEESSLFSQMTRAVRMHSPSHRVVLRGDMAALAATGDEYVYVARDRELTAATARRVVVHEVQGHVVPRVRAAAQHDDLGRVGTYRGEDTQEGYALLCEEREDALQPHRKRELAERHLACAWMLDGADFPDVVERLVTRHTTPPARAVRIATRTFRGSDGTCKGLGRERVYLPYYLLVREHLAKRPEDELRLTSGQRALDELLPAT